MEANLCGICRSDDSSLSGIFFNWTERIQIIQHFFFLPLGEFPHASESVYSKSLHPVEEKLWEIGQQTGGLGGRDEQMLFGSTFS